MAKRVCSWVAAVILLLGLSCTPLFGNKPVLIISGSMEPAIMTNALTLVHYCGISDVDVGDIITYYHSGLQEMITHRVIRKYDDYLLTKGDANANEDGYPVTDANIYGKNFLVLNWTVPFFEKVVDNERYNMSSAVGIILFIAFFAAVLVLSVSFICVYGIALYKSLSKYVYPEETLGEMKGTLEKLECACITSDTFGWLKRVKLYVAYATCRHMLKDLEDELKHI